MRVVQGGLVAFPESALLVDTYPLEYFLVQMSDYYWELEAEVTLDDSYRHYLVNCGMSAAWLVETSSNDVANFRCLIHNVGAGMGTIALVLGDYQWVSRNAFGVTISKQVGVWLRGRLHFQMNAAVPSDTVLFVRMLFIFNRYRR
jgi:hypothetical protein